MRNKSEIQRKCALIVEYSLCIAIGILLGLIAKEIMIFLIIFIGEELK